MLKKRRVNPSRRARRVSLQEEQPEARPHRFEAQLIVQHGFPCVRNVACFSRSLDRAFRDWCDAHVLQRTIRTVALMHSRPSLCQYISHHSLIVRRRILDLHRGRWFHVDHLVYTLYGVPVGAPDRDPLHVWATHVAAQQDEPQAIYQVAFMSHGRVQDEISRVPHPMYVTRIQPTPNKDHFVVHMKTI